MSGNFKVFLTPTWAQRGFWTPFIKIAGDFDRARSISGRNGLCEDKSRKILGDRQISEKGRRPAASSSGQPAWWRGAQRSTPHTEMALSALSFFSQLVIQLTVVLCWGEVNSLIWAQFSQQSSTENWRKNADLLQRVQEPVAAAAVACRVQTGRGNVVLCLGGLLYPRDESSFAVSF